MRSEATLKALREWVASDSMITWSRLKRWMSIHEEPLDIALLLNKSAAVLGKPDVNCDALEQLMTLSYDYVFGMLKSGAKSEREMLKTACTSGGYMLEAINQLAACLRNSSLLDVLATVPGTKWTSGGYKSN